MFTSYDTTKKVVLQHRGDSAKCRIEAELLADDLLPTLTRRLRGAGATTLCIEDIILYAIELLYKSVARQEITALENSVKEYAKQRNITYSAAQIELGMATPVADPSGK